MKTQILIDKGSYDDWSVTSPFAGYTTEGGFLISNVPNTSYVGYVDIPNVLLSMGSINRSVDIFSSGGLDTKVTFKGIGGVSKTGDWNFTLENVSELITPLELLGRKITVVIDDTTIVFVGKIYNCEPSFDSIKFTVRSNFLLWDKEIGTIVDSEIASSNNKIIPIIYGDFTDEGDYIPLIVDLETDYTIKAYTSEQALKEITNVFCWDKDRVKADRCTNGLNDLTINGNNTEITFLKETDITLTEAIIGTNSLDYIYLSECATIGIQFTTSPTFTPGNTFISETSTGDNMYEFIEQEGDIYMFKVGKYPTDIETFIDPANGFYDSLKPSEDADGFRVFGGETTYTVSVSSDIIIPDLFVKQIDWHIRSTYIDLLSDISGFEYDANNLVNSHIIQIDSEKMLIYYTIPIWDAAMGICSKHEVIRGYSNTTKATHTTSAVISFKQETTNNSEHTLKMKTVIPITGVSNWRTLIGIDGYNGETPVSTPYAHKQVREIADYVSNLNLFINNFSYQYRNELGEHLVIQIKNLLNLDYSPYWNSEWDIEDIIMSLLLDLNLGQTTSINGDISGIWLLGSFIVDYPDSIKGSNNEPNPRIGMAIGMRTTDDDTQDFKRVGVNLWHAYKMKLIQKEGKINTNFTIKCEKFNNFDLLLGITELVNWDLNVSATEYEDSVFYKYSNNPPDRPNNWEKSYPLNGVWDVDANVGVLSITYTNGTIDNPKLPQTLDDFLRQKFVLQLFGTCISDMNKTSYWLNNVGFLVEYTINICENDLYFQCQGRVDGSLDLLTNPSDIIKDILTDEIGLSAGDIDATTFAFTATNTATQTCAFSLHDNVIKSSELFEIICKEQGLILGELSNGKIACFTLSAYDTPTTLYNTDILENIDRPDYTEGLTNLGNIITTLNIKYKKRYTDNTFLGQHIEDGFGDAFYYVDQDRKATFETLTIRDETTATTIGDLCLNFYTHPLRILIVKCNPENTMELVPGKWVNFNDDTYVKNTSSKSYLITETNLQPGYNEVNPEMELTLLEVENIEAGEPPESLLAEVVIQDTDNPIEYQM